MEPPKKRARLAQAPDDPFAMGGEDEDEIAMDPEEFTIKQDPNYRLERSRAAADNKLKSAFESLFEKYGKDFGDTGDEINFYTDEIEVDNGHIASLPNAQDASIGSLFSSKNKGNDEEEQEEERILHGAGTGLNTSTVVIPHRATAWSVKGQDRNGHPRVSSLSPPKFGFGSQLPSFGNLYGGFGASGPVGFHHSYVDPAWIVPDLPEAAFSRSRSNGLSFPHFGRIQQVPGRNFVRKALPAALTAGSRNDSDDDDLLLGMCENQPAILKPKSQTDHDNAGSMERSELQESTATPGAQSPTQPHAEERKTATEAIPQEGRRTRTNKGVGADARPNSTQPATSKSKEDKQAAVEEEQPLRRRASRKSLSKVERTSRETGTEISAVNGTNGWPALVIELIERKHMSSGAAPFFPGDCLDTESLPTPPGEVNSLEVEVHGDKPTDNVPNTAASGRKAQGATEIFTRNTVDPSYAFSDDENYGFKKREPRSKTKPTSKESDATASKDIMMTEDVTEGDDITATEETMATEQNAVTAENTAMEDATAMEDTTATEDASFLPVDAQVEVVQPDSDVPSVSPSEPDKTREDEPVAPEPSVTLDNEPSSGRLPERAGKETLLAAPTEHLQAFVPSTPRRKGVTAQQANPGSHRSSIISLVSDDSADEDELSLGYDDFTPKSALHVRNVHTPTKRPSVEASRALARRAYTARRIRKSNGKTTRLMSTSFSSPLLSRQGLRVAETVSPVGSPVQTPGGSIRRCGQDDFKCGRDFCFQCL